MVVDLIAAASLFFAQDIGDAATRGIGQGFGSALGIIALVAAALLFWGARGEGRSIALVLGAVIAGAPVAMTVTLTVSNHGLGLIFPDLRAPVRPVEPSPQYAYPDPASREAALALVLSDYDKLAALLNATPAPDLMARDEPGESLLALATRPALADRGRRDAAQGPPPILAAGAPAPPTDPLPPVAGPIEASESATALGNAALFAPAAPGRPPPPDKKTTGTFPPPRVFSVALPPGPWWWAGAAGACAARRGVLVPAPHLAGPLLPPALAIVNPNLGTGAPGLTALAGVGVVFHLLAALRAELARRGALHAQPRGELRDGGHVRPVTGPHLQHERRAGQENQRGEDGGRGYLRVGGGVVMIGGGRRVLFGEGLVQQVGLFRHRVGAGPALPLLSLIHISEPTRPY